MRAAGQLNSRRRRRVLPRDLMVTGRSCGESARYQGLSMFGAGRHPRDKVPDRHPRMRDERYETAVRATRYIGNSMTAEAASWGWSRGGVGRLQLLAMRRGIGGSEPDMRRGGRVWRFLKRSIRRARQPPTRGTRDMWSGIKLSPLMPDIADKHQLFYSSLELSRLGDHENDHTAGRCRVDAA